MKIMLVANTDWYLYNFRLSLAKALKRKGNEVVFVAPTGEYKYYIEKEGFRFIGIRLNRKGINPIQEALSLIELLRLYVTEKPGLVHHFTIKCILYGSFASRLTNVTKTVNSVTGLGHIFIDESIRAKALKPFVKIAYRYVLNKTKVIFQNSDDLKYFRSEGIVGQHNSFLILGSGVNTEDFIPLNKNANSRKVTVLFAGRLLKTKGIYELIEAAKTLYTLRPNVIFKIAGDTDSGNPATITRKDIDEITSSYRNIQFVGHCHDMKSLYREADIVVLPSYREGVPKVLLEAASCGLPIIATDVPGCREIVRDRVNGLLVPPKDSHSLALAMMQLVDAPELRKKMGEQSRSIVCSAFTEAEVISKTFSTYMST